MRWLIPSISRRSSPNRRTPSSSTQMTSSDHLSAIRSRIVRTSHSGSSGAVSRVCLGDFEVPSFIALHGAASWGQLQVRTEGIKMNQEVRARRTVVVIGGGYGGVGVA